MLTEFQRDSDATENLKSRTAFTYDALNRLTGSTRRLEVYPYDTLAYTYTYDTLGNLLKQAGPTAGEEDSWQYNDLNQMVSKHSCGYEQKLTRIYDYGYTYDKRGNLVKEEYMRIKHRFGFSRDKDIYNCLDKIGMPYEKGDLVSILTIFEDDRRFEQVKALFEAKQIYPLTETVYSSSELESASWLSVRSTWRSGYPFPKENKEYIFSTYNTETYCCKCGAGLIQKANFSVEKEPRWGSRNFLMLNWVHDELFVSEKAASVLKNSDFGGFQIKGVNGKMDVLHEGIYQLYINRTLEYGLKDDSISKVICCSNCNRKRYLLKPGYITYDRSVFDNIDDDIIKSGEQFGEIVCSRIIFISQRFYRFLKEKKLNRGLQYEPIQLA